MQQAETAYEQKILDGVVEHGWWCTSVHDPRGDAPAFAYSIGFTHTLGQPEFIIFGLPGQLMQGVLWNVFRALKAGKRPEDGQRWSGLLDDYDCEIRRVHPSNVTPEYVNSAIWFHGAPEGQAEPLAVYQIVWPSLDNQFPWDDACPQSVRDAQPPLYLAAAH